MKGLRWWFLVIDIGFILYWIITALHVIPAEYLYNDYENPILVDWNWSFLPLDLLISFTGLTSIRLYRQNSASWERWALVSLVFTFVSGLQALAFWTIRGDFDLTWWFFNGILLVYPLFYIPRFFKAEL
ncbi:MAG: DUF5360 family protein [Saprospiraceae bacterium]|nr:DUF5360 family protein [Saprospiraceae bacterium]